MFDALFFDMIRKCICTLFTVIIFTKAFSQSRSLYDTNVARFDFLNNKLFVPLQLEDTSGHIFNTAALMGKTIYVDFWFTSCPPCLREIPYSSSLQKFFATDTNIVFLNICIDNKERRQAWKQMVHDKKMQGIHLFYARNQPQKISLLKEYYITFPTYLLVNKEMRIIGYDAPRPSEEGWAHWAIVRAKDGVLLSESYSEIINHSKAYKDFLNKSGPEIFSLRNGR